jgi:hypothetical protein
VYGGLSAGSDVTVTQPLLLDISTPVLGTITVESGGSIVFDPSSTEAVLQLKARQIIVNAGGSVLAGCEEAPFDKVLGITPRQSCARICLHRALLLFLMFIDSV